MFTTNAKNQVKKVGIDIAQSMGDLTWTMVDQAAKGFDAMKKTPLLSSVDPMQAYGAIKDVASDVVGQRGMQAQKMQRQTNDISGELAKTIGDLVAKKSLSVKEAQGLLENLPKTAADPNASKMKAFLNGIKAGSVATGIAGGVSEAATMALGDQNPLTKMRGMGAPQPRMKTNQITPEDRYNYTGDGQAAKAELMGQVRRGQIDTLPTGADDGLMSTPQPEGSFTDKGGQAAKVELMRQVRRGQIDTLPDGLEDGLMSTPQQSPMDNYADDGLMSTAQPEDAPFSPQPRFKTNQSVHPEANSSLYSPNQKAQMTADEQWFDDAANRLAGGQVDAGGPMPGPGAAGKGRALSPQKLEVKAYDQQAKEIERAFGKTSANDANYGWGVDETGKNLQISTKVYGKGVLNTEVNLKTGEMTHDWSDDALDAMGDADLGKAVAGLKKGTTKEDVMFLADDTGFAAKDVIRSLKKAGMSDPFTAIQEWGGDPSRPMSAQDIHDLIEYTSAGEMSGNEIEKQMDTVLRSLPKAKAR